MAVAEDAVIDGLARFGVERFGGACKLEFDGRITVEVALTADGEGMLLSADIGELDASAAAAQMRRLLQMSHHGTATDGCCLSLDATGERVVLWVSIAIKDMTADDVERRFSAFLDQVEARADELTGRDDASETRLPPPDFSITA